MHLELILSEIRPLQTNKYSIIPRVHRNYKYQNPRHELQCGLQRLDKEMNNYYFLDTGTPEKGKKLLRMDSVDIFTALKIH